jgi:hypothetical protein
MQRTACACLNTGHISVKLYIEAVRWVITTLCFLKEGSQNKTSIRDMKYGSNKGL